MKRIIIIIIALIILGAGLTFYIMRSGSEKETITDPVEPNLSPKHKIIGSSVEGRKIEAYTYGNGNKHLLFVGGIHGGYEWNSVMLAYQFIDYLKINPEIIPDNLSVTIIPSANPDGIYKVTNKEGRFTIADIPESNATVPGRFNANEVDLNRNFDCKWQPESTWRSKTVSAGSEAFSEPEARAIRDFILGNSTVAAIFWHSQANAVYASECENGVLPETINIMNTYAEASGYPSIESFDSYEITGDAEGWLASINIPAITVELKNHENIDWDKNLAGVKALFRYYGEKSNSSTGILPFKSGVKGQVFLGPTCPVVKEPVDPDCTDKPFQTTIQVIRIGSPKSSPFATAKTDINGTFKIILPPGEYGLQAIGDRPILCETKNIIIEPDSVINQNLACDSGIR